DRPAASREAAVDCRADQYGSARAGIAPDPAGVARRLARLLRGALAPGACARPASRPAAPRHARTLPRTPSAARPSAPSARTPRRRELLHRRFSAVDRRPRGVPRPSLRSARAREKPSTIAGLHGYRADTSPAALVVATSGSGAASGAAGFRSRPHARPPDGRLRPPGLAVV